MEFAQPLLPYFSQYLVLDLCSHISLKNTICCAHIPAPDAKLDKVPELLRDSLMPDSSIP
jgi:hypothetical protein